MDFKNLTDFAKQANEKLGAFRLESILSPDLLSRDDYEIDVLKWESIKYGDEELGKVPDDKRGIYAFVVEHRGGIIQPHGYILYVGIAGRKSQRSLRARYRDYLNEKCVMKRSGIAMMIGNWNSVLRFYFSPVDDAVSSEDLENLEKKINGAFLPPFSRGDFEAELKPGLRAFR
jgi:hypothetical protein